MSDSNSRMSDYLVEAFDLETYGCLQMTVAELMEEFDVFSVIDEDMVRLKDFADLAGVVRCCSASTPEWPSA